MASRSSLLGLTSLKVKGSSQTTRHYSRASLLHIHLLFKKRLTLSLSVDEIVCMLYIIGYIMFHEILYTGTCMFL